MGLNDSVQKCGRPAINIVERYSGVTSAVSQYHKRFSPKGQADDSI